MATITHSELILKAIDWLKAKGYPLIITDMVSCASETPDCIGWNSFRSVLIECKASRSDFLRDQHKSTRQHESLGMGNERLYLAPSGMIKPEELPQGWGLLEVSDEGKVRVKSQPLTRKSNKEAETSLLVSAIRRIGQNPPLGISVKCYTFKTQNRATISIEESQDQ